MRRPSLLQTHITEEGDGKSKSCIFERPIQQKSFAASVTVVCVFCMFDTFSGLFPVNADIVPCHQVPVVNLTNMTSSAMIFIHLYVARYIS